MGDGRVEVTRKSGDFAKVGDFSSVNAVAVYSRLLVHDPFAPRPAGTWVSVTSMEKRFEPDCIWTFLLHSVLSSLMADWPSTLTVLGVLAAQSHLATGALAGELVDVGGPAADGATGLLAGAITGDVAAKVRSIIIF
jgi:hypothetical protein